MDFRPFHHEPKNPRGQFTLSQLQRINPDNRPGILITYVEVRRIVIIEV